MIAQARITSDTSATVYLHDESVELDGETVAEVRARVKQVFIDAARKAEATLPVLIVEPDAVHHLQVETTGRIASRTPDGSPVFGPTPDGVDLRSPAPADDPVTATGAPDDAASSPEAHPHETHPHRTDDLDSAPTPPTAGREEDAPTAHSPLMPAPREAEVVRPRPSGSARPGRRSAAVSGTDTHPDTGTAAAVAQSTEQEIDMSASPAAPAPSGPPATSGPSAP
ncbi:MAG: hypothetical protein Q4G40_12925, partial [Brachybacterium sp.]|nr:hypothetical protein [Brachybacterium sp.]